MSWPDRPVIYEINTAVWLNDLSSAAGRTLTLGDIPSTAWDAVTPPGVDAVWLMGVWARSPAGLDVANANAALQDSFRQALPDLCAEDVIGSPYCVRQYVVDEAFGGPAGLAEARAALAERGVRLVLDYVPNHVAPDHPWASARPEIFIQADAEALAADPGSWLDVEGTVLARGRDPYFAPWPDVIQLNAFAPAMRQATSDTLVSIAAQCDGIRCDMAMLVTNEVFATTWHERAGTQPEQEFWPEVLTEAVGRYPNLRLIAEVYWNYESRLQQQGFNFCYDKTLYDRLIGCDATAVHEHLMADDSYQSRLLRFIENHDEPRVADRLSPDIEKACALVVATLPGAVLWHEGQFVGRRVHPPVFLGRRPAEVPDLALADWYLALLTVLAEERIREGEWSLLNATGWPDNQSYRNLLSWSWTAPTARHLIVINLSDAQCDGRIPLPWSDLSGTSWVLTDLLRGQSIERDGEELLDPGLFVELQPWRYHLFALDRSRH